MTIKIVLRNLMAHPLRNSLTAGAVMFAVFLLSFLQAIVTTLEAGVENASNKRLWVQSAVSLYVDLPLSYRSKIAAVEGVDWTCRWQWFGGIYKDPANFFAQFGVDPDTFLKSYPEMSIAEGSYENFQKNRTGCVIGKDLAKTYGFKLGDTIEIIGTIFPRADGSPWQFTIEAIYESTSPSIDQATLYFQYEYLKESLESGAVEGEPGVGVYLAKVADGADPVRIQDAINQRFAPGPQRVSATTEAEFGRQFVSMLGNIPLLLRSIGLAVLVAIFFAVLNTMLTIGQERTRDVGIMKALGFQDASIFRLMITESMVLSLSGGLLGLLVIKLMEPVLQLSLVQRFPGFAITDGVVLLGVGLAAGIGLFAGLIPGMRLRGLSPLKALRGNN